MSGRRDKPSWQAAGGLADAAGPLLTPDEAGTVIPLARALKGRGARSNRAGRYEAQHVEAADDGWGILDELAAQSIATEVREETARRIIARNNSPDVPFSHSINPYRGCEHGCIYCFARPGHAHLGLSPGLDFETKLTAKVNAPQLLRAELAAPGWRVTPIGIGAYTDAYQPIERRYRLTRRLLEVAERFRQPVNLITKSALILRDLDLLTRLARRRLVRVAVSITTLDHRLARALEPRAATPARRLRVVHDLTAANVPVAVMVAPVIPGLTDHELERILSRAHAAGAKEAGYVMLRLPLEISGLFREWLNIHAPGRARRVMKLVQGMRGGRDNDSRFGARMRGVGPYAWLIGRRFELTCRRLGLNARRARLDTAAFRVPPDDPDQPPLPGLLD